MNTMKLDRTIILLKEPKDGDYIIQKNIGFKEENGISLVKDNFLTTWLEKNQTPPMIIKTAAAIIIFFCKIIINFKINECLFFYIISY